MKRFYKEVSIQEGVSGFEVRLDGRPIKTPARRPLALPSERLAEVLAAEWSAQHETIKPETMPLTQLANSAIDGVLDRREEVAADLAGFVETDLVCYWAEHPKELVTRQAHGWQPLIDWVEARYGVTLQPTLGVMHQPQSPAAVDVLRQVVMAMNPSCLAALHMLTTAMGSLVLALAVAEGRLDAKTAFDLSEIDERFQRERWGEDEEAAARRRGLWANVQTAARFMMLLGDTPLPSPE